LVAHAYYQVSDQTKFFSDKAWNSSVDKVS